jgi:hypothetical protein
MPEPIPALTGLPSPVARGPDISTKAYWHAGSSLPTESKCRKATAG